MQGLGRPAVAGRAGAADGAPGLPRLIAAVLYNQWQHQRVRVRGAVRVVALSCRRRQRFPTIAGYPDS